MRHKVAGKKLGRNSGQRAALRRTMIKQLFVNERIQTTRAKAEFIRQPAEKLITLAKRSQDAEDARKVHARRIAASRLDNDKEIVKKVKIGTVEYNSKNLLIYLLNSPGAQVRLERSYRPGKEYASL